MLWICRILFVWNLVSVTHAADGQLTTNASSIVFKETLLARLAPTAKLGEIKISPDNNHLAYSVSHGRRWSMALDGAESGEFDEVRDLLFSPDSTHLAYVRRDSKEVRVILNGQPGKAYADIGKGCMAFSPDSQHFIYVGRPADGQWRAVVDEKEGKPYARIGRTGFAFSPDGQHHAFQILQNFKSVVVVDGVEEAPGQNIISFSFSPDSQHHAYFLSRDVKSLVIMDGKETEFDRVDAAGVFFSPQGHRLMYCAERPKEKFRVFVDGKESSEFDFLGKGLMAFSPNSQRTAFGGYDGKAWRMEVDGKESEGYDGGIMAESLVFSPDSEHVAYAAARGTNWFVVIDGKEGKAYEGIGAHSLVFSPDSKRLAYTAGRAGKGLVVIDGTEREYAGVGSQGVVFSPDSKRVAYVVGGERPAKAGSAQRVMGWRVVVDGKGGKEYDGIGVRPFSFSSDGQHMAYVAVQAKKSLLVVDDTESNGYEQFLLNPSATNFHMLRVLAVRTGRAGEQEFLSVDAHVR